MSGATTLSARVMARAMAVPADTALWAHQTANRKPPQWHSPNEVVLASPFALLRDFSAGDDDVLPTLVFPPLAGHASCIIDKKGHSQVRLCIRTGLTRVYSFDWLSATSATKNITEADRLDFITRAVDVIAGPEGKVNLVGDCQGGWEATLWAAMHPQRVNTLIVAGAPIDTRAGNSLASELMPILIPRGNMALYKAMVRAHGGIVPGLSNVMGSIAMHPATHLAEHLKAYTHVHDREYLDRFNDFYDWFLYPVDLPGKLYLWAVEHLFVKNEMFKGELTVAGQTVRLRSITCPVFLLGGEQDDTTPWQQVHNMRYAVGSSLVRWSAGTWHRAGTSACSSATGRRLSTGRRSWLRPASSHDQGARVPSQIPAPEPPASCRRADHVEVWSPGMLAAWLPGSSTCGTGTAEAGKAQVLGLDGPERPQGTLGLSIISLGEAVEGLVPVGDLGDLFPQPGVRQ